MACREIRKAERRAIYDKEAAEAAIRTDILEDFASYARFYPRNVQVERHRGEEVGFWRLHRAEQGNEVCPFGAEIADPKIRKCGFADSCRGDVCLQLEGATEV